MHRTIALVGAFDTKAADFEYLKGIIESHGHHTLLIDFGVLGEAGVPADVGRAEVAAQGGGDLAVMQQGNAKDEAMRIMSDGLAAVVSALHAEGRIDGIIGMGGTGGTSIATRAMRQLPVGFPKVMVSTMGGGDVSAYTGAKDIVFIPSIVDVAGLNSISRRIYANAAGAISGMVATSPAIGGSDMAERPLVTASMFGNTTAAVDRAKGIVEEAGLEVLVFHATGAGGRTMESLIDGGFITGSLDLTTTELADHVAGGVLSAGPDRCLAAARAGIPTVLAPGCVDMVNFMGPATVPEKYRDRLLYEWNPDITLMRTNVEENTIIGRMIAAAAKAATGPVTVMLPLRGVSMLGEEGGRFHDPAADQACFDAIRAGIGPEVRLVELDCAINDPAFADAAAAELLALIGQAQNKQEDK
jgi:uncharacterized protein (UPF0261 family)